MYFEANICWLSMQDRIARNNFIFSGTEDQANSGIVVFTSSEVVKHARYISI